MIETKGREDVETLRPSFGGLRCNEHRVWERSKWVRNHLSLGYCILSTELALVGVR